MGTTPHHDDHDQDHDDLAAPVHVHLATVAAPLHTQGRRPMSRTVEQIPAGTQGMAVRVLGLNAQRCRAYVRAVGGDVYLGPANSVTPGSGFLLSAAATVPVEVHAVEALWAIPDAAAPATTTVHVMAEHYDG